MSNKKYIASASVLPSSLKASVLCACVVLACGLSMAFTISFWSAMGATTLSCCLLSATGGVFEISKFYALPAFLESKKHGEWGRAVASLGMFAVLSFISMLAGIYALQHNLSINARVASEQSVQYQMHMVSLTTQEEKVKNMLSLADMDAKAGFRQRAKDTLNAINQEQETLNQLKYELLNYSEPKVESTVNIPFVQGSVTSALVILLGMLLEITTTFLICLFRSNKLNRRIVSHAKPTIISEKTIVPQSPQLIKATKVNKAHNKYQEVVEQIKSRTLTPTQRAVKHYANIGSRTVAEFFSRMVEDGVIKKASGNRYILAEV